MMWASAKTLTLACMRPPRAGPACSTVTIMGGRGHDVGVCANPNPGMHAATKSRTGVLNVDDHGREGP